MEITKIPYEVDLVKMYEEQDTIMNSEEYQKYFRYLVRYFEKSDSKSKKNYVSKNSVDGDLLLQNQKNEIKIHPAKFVNIDIYRMEALEELNDILYQLSFLIENRDNISDEERSQFEILKNNYIILKKHLDEIKQIDKNYDSRMEKLYDEKLQIFIELSLKLQQREEIYAKITSQIKIHDKNRLAEELTIVKKGDEMTRLDLSKLKELGAELKINTSELEKWMDWIIACYDYLFIKKKLRELDRIIEYELSIHKQKSTNLLYEVPYSEKKKM